MMWPFRAQRTEERLAALVAAHDGKDGDPASSGDGLPALAGWRPPVVRWGPG